MYGSDAPFHDPGVEIRKVEASGLGIEQQRRVLGTNARRLFWEATTRRFPRGPSTQSKRRDQMERRRLHPGRSRDSCCRC